MAAARVVADAQALAHWMPHPGDAGIGVGVQALLVELLRLQVWKVADRQVDLAGGHLRHQAVGSWQFSRNPGLRCRRRQMAQQGRQVDQFGHVGHRQAEHASVGGGVEDRLLEDVFAHA